MPLASPALEYRHLVRHLEMLRGRFIDPHLQTPLADPREYELNVKIYCVFTHACFEECIEKICGQLLNAILTGWNSRRLNRATVSFIAHFGKRVTVEDGKTTTTCFDRVRKLLEELNETYSNTIYLNHGIDVDYLRNLLYPLAIDFGDDLNQLNSLHMLAAGRGEYAHHRSIKKLLSPQDATNYVEDVLKMWRHIILQAIKLLKELE